MRWLGLRDRLEVVDSHVDSAPTCSTSSAFTDALFSATLGARTGSRRVYRPEVGGALKAWPAGAVRLLAGIIEGHMCQYMILIVCGRVFYIRSHMYVLLNQTLSRDG
jgi:hypothetical protein